MPYTTKTRMQQQALDNVLKHTLQQYHDLELTEDELWVIEQRVVREVYNVLNKNGQKYKELINAKTTKA